jgi:hypothetical protein
MFVVPLEPTAITYPFPVANPFQLVEAVNVLAVHVEFPIGEDIAVVEAFATPTKINPTSLAFIFVVTNCAVI